MGINRHKPEVIVTKRRRVEVLCGQHPAEPDGAILVLVAIDEAIRYALTRVRRFKSHPANGICRLDNKTAERAICSVDLGSEN